MNPDQYINVSVNLDLTRQLLSTKPRVRLEAERELKLSSQVCRKPQVFFRCNKLNGQRQTLLLEKGQYFTTYGMLSKMWDCTPKAARYQLQKWQKSGLIKATQATDKLGFDLGLIINYNPVFLGLNRGIRQIAKNRGQKRVKKQFGTSLSLKNLNKKTTKEVVFLNEEFLRRAFGKLNLLGFTITEMKKIQDSHSIDEILDYHRLLKLSPKVDNPKAWLRAALKGKYSLSRVEECRQELNLARLEIRKAREEERKKKRQEAERLAAEMRRVEEEQRKEKEFKLWLESGDNKVRYTQKIIEIIEEVETNKDTPATIETIKNMYFTRTHYKLFQEAYQRRLMAKTGKALDRLDEVYQDKFQELKKLGFSDEFGERLEELVAEKNLKREQILAVPFALDLEWKIECVKESGFLRARLDSWVRDEIENFRANTVSSSSLDESENLCVSNHFKDQFVGER
jgi:hypothetical protein